MWRRVVKAATNIFSMNLKDKKVIIGLAESVTSLAENREESLVFFDSFN
jgi:hypothetical protein